MAIYYLGIFMRALEVIALLLFCVAAIKYIVKS